MKTAVLQIITGLMVVGLLGLLCIFCGRYELIGWAFVGLFAIPATVLICWGIGFMVWDLFILWGERCKK